MAELLSCLGSLAYRVICFLARLLCPLSFAISDCPSSGSSTNRPLPLTRDIVPRHPSSGPRTSSSTYIDDPEASVNILPDDVLLQIFDFYRKGRKHPWSLSEWCPLLLVCQRWRQLVISSPHRLYLYILCTRRKSFRKSLDLLPTFPIEIDFSYFHYNTKKWSRDDEEDILAALEHPNRTICLSLYVTRFLWEKVATVAQEQFPMLTELSLASDEDETVSALPIEFLGGCTPRLRRLLLKGIPFPTLPTFLSFATDLVNLNLQGIPHAGYISPEAMVVGLAALTRLDVLVLEFQSASRPDCSGTSRRAALPTQVVLPALTFFSFRGTGEYLEDLVTQVEAPRLYSITITYLEQHIFYVPQLFKFVGQVQVLEQPRRNVIVFFESGKLDIHFQLHVENDHVEVLLDLQGSGQSSHCQDSTLASTLRRCSEVFSGVEHLSIKVSDLYTCRQDDMWLNYLGWMRILRRFTAVETLLVPPPLAGYIAGALEDEYVAGDMGSDLWPALRLLCLEGQPLERVEKFISARQLSARPVTVVSQRNVFLDLLRQTP